MSCVGSWAKDAPQRVQPVGEPEQGPSRRPRNARGLMWPEGREGREKGCQVAGGEKPDPPGPGERPVTRHGVVWRSQPCPAGEKLEEQLGACRYDADQTGGGTEKENAIGSGHILKIKPTGLAAGLAVGYEGRVARMLPALGGESREAGAPVGLVKGTSRRWRHGGGRAEFTCSSPVDRGFPGWCWSLQPPPQTKRPRQAGGEAEASGPGEREGRVQAGTWVPRAPAFPQAVDTIFSLPKCVGACAPTLPSESQAQSPGYW